MQYIKVNDLIKELSKLNSNEKISSIGDSYIGDQRLFKIYNENDEKILDIYLNRDKEEE